MCTETGIKDVYRRAVTHAGGTAERSERRAVGMGLKLVYYLASAKWIMDTKLTLSWK